MLYYILMLLYLIPTLSQAQISYADYLTQRQKIILEEASMSFGANIVLDKNERIANDVLMKYKHEELKAAYKDPRGFPPSRSFLHVADRIALSQVFRIIRTMPKGGVLHAHITAVTSRDFIIGNITRRPHLYACRRPDASLRLRFLNESMANSGFDGCHWRLLQEARLHDCTIDDEISDALTMYKKGASDDGDEAWRRFLGIFCFVKSLVTYRPVYEDFLYHIMEELYDDNIQFMEIRAPFSTLYELNGDQHKHLKVVEIYKKVVDRFVREHPGFLGVKWIYSPQRRGDRRTFLEHVRILQILKKAHPDVVVGFDLVGQEDKGRPLKDYAKELHELSKETRFFFHAGETNLSGQDADENLVDAILLNTTRIGHGLALLKHPRLMQLIKERGIAVELSPISNQVLHYVKDLRNHPASHFFAVDLPMVVSNDDPGFWGARALSYDFYEAFMGIMSGRADLKALKQLALNSIAYSSLNEGEKQRAMEIWTERWREFILQIGRGA